MSLGDFKVSLSGAYWIWLLNVANCVALTDLIIDKAGLAVMIAL